jgi:hypothetical protein
MHVKFSPLRPIPHELVNQEVDSVAAVEQPSSDFDTSNANAINTFLISCALDVHEIMLSYELLQGCTSNQLMPWLE